MRPSRSPSRLPDAFWRTTYRLGFPLARIWWRIRRPRHEGVVVAIYVGSALLLVRSSYRSEWSFPGGGIGPGELPEAAARRELIEEIGFAALTLRFAGIVSGIWDWRRDRVHCFELRLDRLPELHLDNREIIAARLVQLADMRATALTGPTTAYLDQAGHA